MDYRSRTRTIIIIAPVGRNVKSEIEKMYYCPYGKGECDGGCDPCPPKRKREDDESEYDNREPEEFDEYI